MLREDKMEENYNAVVEQKNVDVNNKKKDKKPKSKVGAVIRGILLFLAGAVAGSIAITLLFVLVVFGILGVNNKRIETLVGQSTILDKDTAWKVEELDKIIHMYYYEDIDDEALTEGIYAGVMAGVGDPYTCYYTPEEFTEMQASWNGNYEGIGAYLKFNQDTGYCTVEGFIDGGSAGEAGTIAEGDYIIAVNGEEMYGKTIDEVVALVRGPEGTTVTVTFEGVNGRYDVTLERRKIETPTVKYEAKEDGIWYIQITEFDTITSGQFKEAIQAARDDDMKGLIIDLRGNPGGSVDAVVDVCREILPKGLVVYTEDKYGTREEFKCDGDNELTVPLVVLVDGGSASAAEIMAGAIKDYGIGTLIGTKTYGKGIVQSILPLQDGSAVKITTSRYFTPNGNNIHKIGIEPDEEVKFDADAYLNEDRDNQLEYAMEYLKKKITN